jgi:type II secretory pathway component GspD/PulD (secretin)
MIGYEEELALIEQLIDTLDVAQADPRSPRIYDIENIEAEQALEELRKLEVLKTSGGGAAIAAAASKGSANGEGLAGEPLVSILEATNQLLVRATPDQHARIGEFLNYVDVAPGSTRTLAYYQIQCIEAEAARRMLEELGIVGGGATALTVVSGPNESSIPRQNRISKDEATRFLTDEPQVVVSESTNGLLVNATVEQHERIAGIIEFIDRKTPDEELSVQIYPVENSSPEHISDMLERLLLETKEDPEGKIERIPKTQEQITVVPDPNTYSLIVHASQKNQLWIEDLVTKLDKRRPQVLIDVTLVEVTRTDTFEYDLNLVANADDAVVGNIVIDSIQKVDSSSRLEGGFNLLDQDGNPTGQTKAFYSDEKVQALLTAIQRKNYGRVLAKPKVLVDDGQEGQIVTTDETTYVKESIQIPQTGTPITTRDFVPIQASIQLQITPHISEGNLLRLNVHLSRDDFGTRPLSGAPPDKASSEVTTTVFVPDDRTVILGGLVKLNQSKGGSKVPILGDVPLVGALFRSIDNSDVEKKLYVFLKANIVRPYEESRLQDLQKISEEHQKAFEKSESEFQEMEDFPGIRPEPMQPKRILENYQ